MFSFGKKKEPTLPKAPAKHVNGKRGGNKATPSKRVKSDSDSTRRSTRKPEPKLKNTSIKDIKDIPPCLPSQVATSEAYSGELNIDALKIASDMIVIDTTSSSNSRTVVLVYVAGANPALNPRIAAIRASLKEGGYKTTKTYQADKKIIDAFHANISKGISMDTSDEAKFAEDIILKGVDMGASDVHITVGEYTAEVEYRVDGRLRGVEQLDVRRAHLACSVMFGTFPESSESDGVQFNPRLMQNAKFMREINSATVACRFASTPKAPSGFKVVLRILKQEKDEGAVPFEKFGYEPGHIVQIEQACRKPVGLTIIAGVTGSGKSTTLANMVKQAYEWSRGTKSIYTVEDPPEYTIECATQIPVIRSADIDKPFALALRGCMRLDPDIIMVGEIRDGETAKLTEGAVTSGHQVIATIHTTSWLGIINRLLYYGMNRDDLTQPMFLSSLIYQKLLPVVCPHCSAPMEDVLRGKAGFELSESNKHIEERLSAVADNASFGNVRIHNPEGCSKCKGSGTAGRTVAAEMATPDRKMLELIADKKNLLAYDHWRQEYDGKGVVGMKAVEHGLRKVLRGTVCPLHVEDEFENFLMLAAQSDHVITSDEIESMRGKM